MIYFMSTCVQKILSFFLVIVQSVLGLSGFSFDLSGVCTRGTELSYSFEYSTEKVFRTDAIRSEKSGTMHLAKNEREDCQIVVHNRSSFTKAFRIELSEFKNAAGESLPAELFCVVYVPFSEQSGKLIEYPDALVPYSGKAQKIDGHSNQPFFIEVVSSADTAHGSYTAKITVTELFDDGSSEKAFTADVTAQIWNFTLPTAPSCETAMGLSSNAFYTLNGVENGAGSPEGRALYKQYYDYLLDRGISAYNIPFDLMDPRADEYMSDERVTSFNMPYFDGDDNLMKSYYDKVNSNESWAKKGYYYMIDEPKTQEAYDLYNQVTQRLARVCPGYNMVTPFNRAAVLYNGSLVSTVDLQAGKSDILCGVSNLYDIIPLREKVSLRQAAGDRSWWYVCCKPLGDFCNFHMSNNGLCHRILFWQQKALGITGLLYWNTVYWEKSGNPFECAQTWNPTAPGDGSLLYPGKQVGVDGPVASVRLIGAANGIEDYEYLTMAQALLGEDALNAAIGKVTQSLTIYTLSDSLFEKVREELGSAIEQAGAANG